MMQSLNQERNGFKVVERNTDYENRITSVSIEILKSGILVRTEDYNQITFEEKNKIVAQYLAAQMEVLGIAETTVTKESIRLAKKTMKLDLINGYKIIPLKEDFSKIEVQLLKNGEFSKSTVLSNITQEKLKKLQKKLNGVVEYQLDIRSQSRPLYGVEIISLIS